MPTVQTTNFFQMYWSRFLIFIHGILAGLGLSHIVTVTSIINYYNYEPKTFIGIYTWMSLNIHYVFYVLTALCIISCFDRMDIGYLNRTHWRNVLNFPSMWCILFFYIVSLALTMSNQLIEERFDAYSTANITAVWHTESYSAVQRGLIQWYQKVWARDLLVLLAWLLIALFEFPDFQHLRITNMDNQGETEDADGSSPHDAPVQTVQKWPQMNLAYGDSNETWTNLEGECTQTGAGEDWTATAEEVIDAPSNPSPVDPE